MIRSMAAVCIALASAAPAWAAPLIDQTDDPARRTAIDGAHRQLATCTAFFLVIAEAFLEAPRAAAAVPDALVGQMLRLRDESLTRARIEAERQFLELVMGSGGDGYRRLREAFGEPCETMAADPQGHVDRWLAAAPPAAR